MVHKLRQDDGGEATTEGRKKTRRRQGGDAITAIKRKMLRCSKAGEQRRFKRSYLAGSGEQADASSAVFFYLACIACAPA